MEHTVALFLRYVSLRLRAGYQEACARRSHEVFHGDGLLRHVASAGLASNPFFFVLVFWQPRMHFVTSSL